MTETRIKVSSVVENQLPEYVKIEFPLVSEFLKQYYLSLEGQGSSYDLIQNIDKYIKLDNLINLKDSTSLTSVVSYFDTTINVESTAGFPDSYGLLLIDSEIITYKEKTTTSFLDCIRGFSGTTSLQNSLSSDELVFSTSSIEEHGSSASVSNLSILFLQQFFKKLKIQVVPGFEDRTFYSQLNQGIFIKQAKDFYASKGTEQSFEILFRALYGKDVEVIRPQEYLIQPSDADYKITKDLVVEVINGNPLELLNKTVYQDENPFLPKARGTVSQVEKIQRADKEYHVLSLDYGYQRDIDVQGTIFGEFSIHPKTLLITDIIDTDINSDNFSPSSTTLDVDSTVGFPQSGELLIDLENGTQLILTYTDKTLTQFLNCSGITQPIPRGLEIKSSSYAYGFSDSEEEIKFRITGVLTDLDIIDKTSLMNSGDPIRIRSLGDPITDYKFNNWIFNISTTYESRSIELLDSSNKSYLINFYDNHSFGIGDKVSILPAYSKPGSEKIGTVISYNNKKSITISGQGDLDLNTVYDVRKILSRLDSINYPDLIKYTTNVQNVYTDRERSLYVTSPSLPTYLNQKINVNDKSLLFSGTFDGTDLNIGLHPFYTGDAVFYRSSTGSGQLSGITDGFYFVKKINESTIQLARSRTNIDTGKILSVSGTIENHKLEFASFVSEISLETNNLEPQKLIRKISDPIDGNKSYTTEVGSTGILVNGVEILNYKSKDSIFYGPIKSILSVSSGSGYDIINPPILQITDSVGYGVSAYCSVIGGLDRIDIIDGGFDYVTEPEIIISGGNGSGAKAKSDLITFDHYVKINVNQKFGFVNGTNLTLTFVDEHKFRNYEKIIYDPQGSRVIGGLSTNSSYNISIVDSKTVKLYNTYSDSVLGINTVVISNSGEGIHQFRTLNKKKKIGSITILDPGYGYTNKKISTNSSGINTASNTITIPNHGYSDGEIIIYDYTNSPIVGLSSTSKYIVTKIDSDTFKLSEVSTSSTQLKNINYKIKEYVNFISPGNGTHIFNYEPITVTVSGNIGVSTLSGQNFNATLQPIFRGSIESVHIENGGSSYGSEDILNYKRQPEFLLLKGENAEITPVIQDGSITEIIINSPGINYNSPPNLIINGSGYGAILSPIVSNGSLTAVEVISRGVGYSTNTTVDVVSAGDGSKFEADINEWNINLVERYFQTNQITDDDGVLDTSFSNFGLQYLHPYSPRKLRSSVLASRYKNGEVFYEPDLIIDNGKELTSISHSPIIGWSYDGNPIYGPYAYSTPNGGSIKSMVSGYAIRLHSERPKTSLYPLGLFVEDYEFIGKGDLDEHNGRFCVTPEYPNGTYAYFTTINSGEVESNGIFKNYKLPVFPYFIGNRYKSKPNEFNKLKTSNQKDISINDTGWIRNTTPYNLTESNSKYEFLYNSNKIKEQISNVKSVTRGKINSIGIISGGKNYKINDIISFKDIDLSSRKPSARVSLIKGKEVTSLSLTSTESKNIEIYPFPSTLGNYVGFSTLPINLNNQDLVVINSDFQTPQTTKIFKTSNILISSSGIASITHTGLVTYFGTYGNIKETSIKENDIYQIGNEQIKILNVDNISSRVRVLRNYNGTSGITSYSPGIAFTEISRKVFFNYNVENQNEYDFNLNKEFYFDPIETLGLGSTSGPGISTVLVFSNPGVGITQISIPTRSLYLPKHGLNSGDELIYSSNGDTPISVSDDGISSYQLDNNSIVYATKLTSDLIGISTNRVGLGTTGLYAGIGFTSGLLYFTNVGTGKIHSFKTNYEDILLANIFKNEVTVSTASSHGLKLNDTVIVDISSGISTEISISYNDYNRRTIIGERSFISSDVDTIRNTITIKNHGFFTSQKVIHKSASSSGGLENESIYYVIVVDDDTIKLSNSFYYSSRRERNTINITSASLGSILPINPPVKLLDNKNLVFNLSSSTLSFTNNGVLYSGFDLDFYFDSEFKHKFIFTTPNSPEFVKVGRVGIDTNASISLRLREKTPQKIYYKLTPINLNILPTTKKEIIVDDEIPDNNSISIEKSVYNGNHKISGISLNTFKFTLTNLPNQSLYNLSNSEVSYTTDSLSPEGEIEKINIEFAGSNLNKIPEIEKIISDNGQEEILDIKIENIGSVTKTKIGDIGFNYPSDYSVRPIGKLPDILKIIPQSSFNYIGITSVGRGYYTPPNLVVLDGLTGNFVDDVDLRYNIESKTVKILKNTKSLNNKTPKIIPINNSNGIKISSINFISSSKDVVVTLGASFSDPEDFPFQIGDKVLVENTSVGLGSTGRGYNSSNYNYALFTIVNVDDNLGGAGATVSYNLSNYLLDGEIPGNFNPDISSGKIIPEKYFPVFNISLKKNIFNIGENVSTLNARGFVVSWDPNNEDLKVSTTDTFNNGDVIVGESSFSRGIISDIITSNCNYVVGSASTVYKGWQKETGFLDNQFQRVHDNDYYQYFSYALRSHIPFDTWGTAVGNLNHTAGFKKFSDLVIESLPPISGISTEQNLGEVFTIADLYQFIDTNCVYDYDLVTENNFTIDSKIKSDQIIFNSKFLQDYIESIGNRVLLIDDIGKDFNSDPRPTQFSIIDTFDLTTRSLKYVAYVKDRRYSSQRQVSLITLLHDGVNAYVNQYGGVYSYYDMGYFDFSVSGDEANLLFYPVKSKINDYNVNLISFDFRDTISNIGSTSLGNSVFVGSATTSISIGTSSATTIVGIASTYRSSKVLVQIGATDSSYYEFNELSVIHDGSNVYLQEYGQLTSQNLIPSSSVGLGTYHAYYSGSNINIDFIPYNTTSLQYDCNSIRVSIANSLSSGIGTEVFNNSKIISQYTNITSSPTPGITTISSYDSAYEGAYCIVSIEDLTNKQYQLSEVIILNDDSEVYLSEFGIIQTSNTIGSIGATITSGGNVSLTFTPIENIDVQIRLYQTSIGDVNVTIPNRTIDFTNSLIRSQYGFYAGSETDVRRQFYLTHKQNPIFERYFLGNSVDFVDIQNNTITIPEHFFITGEKIKYTFAGQGTNQAIGIATTSISGIGLTDKLPSTLYIVKDSDLKVKVAGSAEDALSANPKTLDITSVGVGTLHKFESTNQNARVLISIDNLIQSPIVSTSITTTSSKNVSISEERISFSGITSFFGGDLIKIDDEIMRINYVGLGSTNNVIVDRAWMGSGISTHSADSLIVKVSGDYNIVDNTIHFITAPYGPTPIGTITNPPDSRDYVGIETRSKFSGRSFIRSGITNGIKDTYSQNYIFDDISHNFNGITTSFTLKSNNTNISGISTSNAIVLVNDILQSPLNADYIDITDNYDLSEKSGITTITFSGTGLSVPYDINTASVPRGGIIVSVGSSSGFGYQPLVSAGGTAIVSAAGTIQSISIGNSGSGYRSGIQTVVNVGVATSSTGIPNIEFVGVASVINGHIVNVTITNPGSGYTSTNPPIVLFDDPLSYSDIPLKYISGTSGIGTESTVDIVVGQGSSVISFEIKNTGYGYKVGETLTVDVGGTTGIPTNTNLTFSQFQVFVDRTFEDEFKGWSIGDLQVIDSWDSLFDGKRVKFPIKINGNQTTIRSKKGSSIEVKSSLIILVNNVIQIPDESYTFNGGSIVTFAEAPKPGDKSKILFYRGTGGVDTQFVNILETVKEGDTLTINSDIENLKENRRLVTDIISADIVETNVYSDSGITDDETLIRPVTWCRQTEDKIINGKEVFKSRLLYEPLIYPFSNLIENVGSSSTIMYVESVKTFFDSHSEYLHDGNSEIAQNKIIIISQDTLTAAAATSVVSTSGTISSVVIIDNGVGYTTSPSVIIQSPIGLGSTSQAIALSTISGGSISSITVVNSGIGYSQLNPPSILIEPPKISKEVINGVSYVGDFGIIVGFGTTTVSGSNRNVFDFYIPNNSYLKNTDIVGTAITISQLNVGDFFVIKNSNIGSATTELYTYRNDNSTIGISSQFVDGIYQVASVEIKNVNVSGIGNTYIKRVFAKADASTNTNVSLAVTAINFDSTYYTFDSTENTFDYFGNLFYGEFSWGKISIESRTNPKGFNCYGFSGINTSPKVIRFNPLKYNNYIN
jgi:hypothetical protein